MLMVALFMTLPRLWCSSFPLAIEIYPKIWGAWGPLFMGPNQALRSRWTRESSIPVDFLVHTRVSHPSGLPFGHQWAFILVGYQWVPSGGFHTCSLPHSAPPPSGETPGQTPYLYFTSLSLYSCPTRADAVLIFHFPLRHS